MTDVLVTGFEPFGKDDRNPSQEVACALDGRTLAGMRIAGRILPVSMQRIAEALRSALDETHPRLIVSLGLANGQSTIRVERYGVNLADFPIPDNDGSRNVDLSLAGNGPLAVATTLPNRAIHDALLAAGIPARLSTSAGAYLCNACIYLTAGEIEARGWDARFGFLHLPYLPEQVAALLAGPRAGRLPDQLASMSLETMIRAVELALGACAQSNVTIARAVSRS
jgi:pyroglutamyl-peptidase